MLSPILALALAATVPWLDPMSVQPGQRGTCVTEWSGGVRREIPVEVVGILDAAGPERTAVLIRILDPDFADGGVMAGMSGSPVYLDGKLLGAVAFGWGFAREPLAGVTPFATMRDMTAFSPPASLPPPTLQELGALAAGRGDPLAALPQLDPGHTGVAMPVVVAGLPPGDGDWGQRVLTRAGMGPAVPAGLGAPSGIPAPGEMMAALLVWGDAVVASGGTVTAREGNTLWAFGHPLYGLGSLRLPVARASVLAIQRSFQVPFKLFSVGQQFGTLLADRPSGVVVEVGTPPAGLPVDVELQDGSGLSRWHFQVVKHPLLAPLLVTYVANACLTARGSSSGESAVWLTLLARMADGQSLEISQTARSADAPARLSAFAGAVTAALAASPLPHPDLATVEVRLRRDEQPAGATLTEVLPSRTVVRPGDTLAVEVRLQPHQTAPASRRLTVQIPATLTPGDVDLVVADGAAWTEYLLKTQPATPATFEQLLASLRRFRSSTTLVVALESREKGVALPGGVLAAVPPSWALTLGNGLRGELGRLATTIVATSHWTAPYPLEGAVRVPLQVRVSQEIP